MAQARCWLTDSLTRVFPATPAGKRRVLALDAGRGEMLAAQACVRLEGEQACEARLQVSAPAGITARVRRVGLVPMWQINTATPARERDGGRFLPGLCPDPLLEEEQSMLGPGQTTAFWLTLRVSRLCRPGIKRLRVVIELAGRRQPALELRLRVHPLRVGRLRDFPVTNWFYADSLLDWYRLKAWEPGFWRLLTAYLRNLVEHRQDTVYVPVFTPPLDGVKRPSQLLIVKQTAPGSYRFDWRYVKRWVDAARKAGLRHLEWCHLFTQWGARHALRIYHGTGEDGARLLWKPNTPATGRVYRRFLAAFLPALKRFLEREGLMRESFFHVSDEPHTEEDIANYRRARELLRELAPWMRVMDAISDIRFGRERLTDTPIPTIRTALDFRREGIESWCYFCCGPRGKYLNRLLDTPLTKIRMAGWLFHRFRMRGFLHWGYNYWQRSQTAELIDPFTEASGHAWPNWAYGDTFVVYPGPRGPLDSIRWEVWAQSLQDMALLQAAGVDADDPILRPLRNFERFPRQAAWVRRTRACLLEHRRR